MLPVFTQNIIMRVIRKKNYFRICLIHALHSKFSFMSSATIDDLINHKVSTTINLSFNQPVGKSSEFRDIVMKIIPSNHINTVLKRNNSITIITYAISMNQSLENTLHTKVIQKQYQLEKKLSTDTDIFIKK